MSKRILVVDDEPDLLSLVQNRLESKGFEVVVARDGIEALEKTEEILFDLILLDVCMPRMDGYTFVQCLKKSQRQPNVPIIIITAKEKMESLFELEGISHYVVKPLHNEELLAKIEGVIGKVL